jgi:hypothetical protein
LRFEFARAARCEWVNALQFEDVSPPLTIQLIIDKPIEGSAAGIIVINDCHKPIHGTEICTEILTYGPEEVEKVLDEPAATPVRTITCRCHGQAGPYQPPMMLLEVEAVGKT